MSGHLSRSGHLSIRGNRPLAHHMQLIKRLNGVESTSLHSGGVDLFDSTIHSRIWASKRLNKLLGYPQGRDILEPSRLLSSSCGTEPVEPVHLTAVQLEQPIHGPFGLPNPTMELYPSTQWSKNYCWLDTALEILSVLNRHDATPWIKLKHLPFQCQEDASYIWSLLCDYFERRTLIYLSYSKSDIPQQLQVARNGLGDALGAIGLKSNPLGGFEGVWVRTD
jgi:hypothetical protein